MLGQKTVTYDRSSQPGQKSGSNRGTAERGQEGKKKVEKRARGRT